MSVEAFDCGRKRVGSFVPMSPESQVSTKSCWKGPGLVVRQAHQEPGLPALFDSRQALAEYGPT